jgi:hypothetical protein
MMDSATHVSGTQRWTHGMAALPCRALDRKPDLPGMGIAGPDVADGLHVADGLP